MDGQDPDKVVNVGTNSVDIGDGMSWAREVMAPAWTAWEGETRRVVAAVRAMGLLN